MKITIEEEGDVQYSTQIIEKDNKYLIAVPPNSTYDGRVHYFWTPVDSIMKDENDMWVMSYSIHRPSKNEDKPAAKKKHMPTFSCTRYWKRSKARLRRRYWPKGTWSDRVCGDGASRVPESLR